MPQIQRQYFAGAAGCTKFAAHCSGKQCESIFNQTKYSVAYKSSRKSSYRCMFFKEVKLTVRCQIIVNKIA